MSLSPFPFPSPLSAIPPFFSIPLSSLFLVFLVLLLHFLSLFLSLLALEKESRTSGNHTPTKEDKLQHLEENALVEAIRDTFLPGLSHSDAAIFVTLTVEVFEDTNVPMIFGVHNDVQDGKLVLNDPVSNIEQIPRKANSSVPGSNGEGELVKIHVVHRPDLICI